MKPYLSTLALTVVIETLVALLVMPHGARRGRIVDVVLANLVTHPLATLAVWELDAPWTLAEAGVVVAETLIYALVSGFTWSRAAVVAIVCNIVTASLSFAF